ncbi:hypothetical protein E1295_09195 [Nonomuraea mesophila]|uniref:DUF11 domain-containing protein n=1 Tax=Nonomuraea mesophila TaxID=2530382 RepID=A0A4R5FTM0_9ACTN|nr:DUF11 domain-containing protein [Nonomuraea mesophila]TDE57001.1 hypothetical protein E1295_09195 [Nonomuraea mesophila]
MRTRTIPITAAAALALAGLTVPVAAASGAGRAASPVAGAPADTRPRWPHGADESPRMDAHTSSEFWTPARMKAALGAPLPETELDPPHGEGAARVTGVPSSQRLTPGGDRNGYAKVRRPYGKLPHTRATGRLFFVDTHGKLRSCTASVVRSRDESLIATAAQCVYGTPEEHHEGADRRDPHGHGWHHHLLFVPGYDGDGEREPYSRWGAVRAWKPSAYTGHEGGDANSPYDLALVRVENVYTDQTLQDRVGAYTVLRNQGGAFKVNMIGYPAVHEDHGYQGKDQLWCLGRTRPSRPYEPRRHDVRFGGLTTHNCQSADGDNGGPWMVRAPGSGLVGVTSTGRSHHGDNGSTTATAMGIDSYGAVVRAADPHGVYDQLSISADVAEGTIEQGESTTATLTVAMRGLSGAAGVPVTVWLPRGFRLVPDPESDCEGSRGEVTCMIDAIYPGQTVELNLRIAAGDAAPGSHRFRVAVERTHLNPEPRATTASFRIRVLR